MDGRHVHPLGVRRNLQDLPFDMGLFNLARRPNRVEAEDPLDGRLSGSTGLPRRLGYSIAVGLDGLGYQPVFRRPMEGGCHAEEGFQNRYGVDDCEEGR